MDIKQLNERLENTLNEYVATKDMLESEASEIFQPFITIEQYKNEHKEDAYMVWGANIVYVGKGGSQREILVGSSKNMLLGKIRAIKTYREEINMGRNKITL